MNRDLALPVGITLILASAFYAYQRPVLTASELAFSMVMFSFLIMVYLLGAAPSWVRWARAAAERNHSVALLAPIALFLAFLAAPAAFIRNNHSWRVAAYLFTPFILFHRAGDRLPDRLTARDAAVILGIWLPLETGWLHGPLLKIMAIDLALVLFLIVRRLEGMGYEFRVARGDLRIIAGNILFLLPTLLPIGLASGFIRFSPTGDGASLIALRLLGIFFVTALPEELLFRSLIQNLVQKSCRRAWPGRGPWIGLLISALIFGAAHLNDGDWRYGVLAFIAGMSYGHAYQATGRVIPAALVHTVVDAIWIFLFKA